MVTKSKRLVLGSACGVNNSTVAVLADNRMTCFDRPAVDEQRGVRTYAGAGGQRCDTCLSGGLPERANAGSANIDDACGECPSEVSRNLILDADFILVKRAGDVAQIETAAGLNAQAPRDEDG